MYYGLHGKFAALTLLACVASGCVQATRHSNTMYFGTNTTFGIKAGANTGGVPEVVVGYDRQEAVIMPLVANTSSASDSTVLNPCDLTKELKVLGNPNGYLVHPCSLVAYKGGSMDSYSVIASFGAQFSAETAGAPKAGGGLAQYFATGMAAQILAAQGGAALVATGEGAKESAEKTGALASLFPEGTAFAQARAVSFDNSISTLRARIKSVPSAQVLQTKITNFLAALALPNDERLSIKTHCTSVDACLDAVNDDVVLLHEAPKLESAVAGWDGY